MKHYKIVYILLLIGNAVFAQNHITDSLKNRLNKTANETEKIRLLNEIANEYLENDPAAMLNYSRQALRMAQKKELSLQEADSWFNIGNASIMLSKYTDALKSFTNAQAIYENAIKQPDTANKDDIKSTLASTYGSIGIVCSEQNNYAKSLEYYFKALKLYLETGQEDVAGVVYNNIGIVYETQKDYTKALEYFNKALWIQKKMDDASQAVTISNIGKVYLAGNDNDKALQSFKEAEAKFRQYDNRRGQAELYNNYGNYYAKKNDLNTARQYYTKALAAFKETGEKYGASASLGYLGKISALQNNNAQAVAYFKESAALAEEIGTPEQVKESEKELSMLYEKMGDSREALIHYKKYSDAKEKINNSENIKSMVREEMNYEFERKEALQKVENEKREAVFSEQSKRHRMQMLFTALLALLLFGIAFLIYSRLQLKKRLTLQRDLAEYEQKALHLQMNPHFVFNCLGSISSFIVQNGTDSAIKYLSKFSKLMRLTLEYSKESLIPIDKEIEGLQNYLELEQLRFNRMFDFSITKDTAIEDDMAIPPLLLQPFVENAIIHGIVPKKQHGNIYIDFALNNDKLVCTVTDDGIGIHQSRRLKENSVTVHKSLALEITKKRLEVIQAVTAKTSQVEITEITNALGEPGGTKIVLNLPVQYSSN
ncbi:tetratricopeptide repeat protein [Flavobacterium sp. Sd200]|uniref:tetratricopeptide repeat-containing sensor histidine kinase n=1 Tax=Flavobacterium sp. Sd200 TaxID=2692211 RepID=UPI00136F3237|nr:tetratricopeptide repeat protein [Flavobacterium sp. Sd200]MXN90358.1 tetratricopeptide repeat protein [Flavobacterium sp. Sd200]